MATAAEVAEALIQGAEQTGLPLEEAFRSTAASVRRTSEQMVAMLYEAWQAGTLSDVEFEEALRNTLITSVTASTQLGDVIAATYLATQPLGQGIDPETVERLGKAAATATTLLDGTADPLPRLTRLGVSEPLNALQQGTVRAYSQHGVAGYVRGIDDDPCELCTWLYRDGHVWPSDQPMHQHPGCTCVPVPVTNK